MMKSRRRFVVAGLCIAAGAFCFAAPEAAAQPSVTISVATGQPGQNPRFAAILSSGGANVTAVQTDITVDPVNTPVLPLNSSGTGTCSITQTKTCTTNTDCPMTAIGTQPAENEPCVNQGAPNCQVNKSLAKGGYFSYISHSGCTTDCACSGTSCAGVRAVVLALNNLSTIPNGSVLFSCEVGINGSAALQDYALTASGAVVSNDQQQAACGVDPQPACGTGAGKVVVSATAGCTGDLDGNGSVSASEAAKAFQALARRDVTLNPAADTNNNGAVSSPEAARSFQNLAHRQCQ
jgi:hypothetical protein